MELPCGNMAPFAKGNYQLQMIFLCAKDSICRGMGLWLCRDRRSLSSEIKVGHVLAVIKRLGGYAEVRYRGLAKAGGSARKDGGKLSVTATAHILNECDRIIFLCLRPARLRASGV